jgi:pyruvate kinase
MRRAKIVATLGPASSDPSTVQKLIEHGVDVARLNFSHGRLDEHAEVLDRIRAASRRVAKPVAVLQDLQGPKIRTGPLKAGKAGVALRSGAELVITTERELPGDEQLVSTTYPHLAQDVRAGDRLLVDDGLIELRVVDSDGVRARCEVIEGGLLKEHKGINLPGVALRAEAMSDKDKRDLAFGLAHGVDYVALSFVRTAEDVASCRAEMERNGRVVPIVAKIEKPEALERIDAIIAAADGVMVARGDLGVEIEPERVPAIQKTLLQKANAAGKPVIIATQMLESMIEHPRPTRAEASDVANAIWDGADAVMLSGESASGRYPLLAVQMMDRIVRDAETQVRWNERAPAEPTPPAELPEVIAAAACRAATQAGAVAICCFTLSGATARLLSHHRPPVPVIGFSPDHAIRRRLALYWGVLPRIMEPIRNSDLMAEMVSERLVTDGLAKPGDRVVLVHGSPLGIPGKTNSLRIHEIPAHTERSRGEDWER